MDWFNIGGINVLSNQTRGSYNSIQFCFLIKISLGETFWWWSCVRGIFIFNVGLAKFIKISIFFLFKRKQDVVSIDLLAHLSIWA
jgi:hypothetical protein